MEPPQHFARAQELANIDSAFKGFNVHGEGHIIRETQTINFEL
jgi:hypothetical protein